MADLQAAVPRCPKVPVIAHAVPCGRALFNDYASEQWACPFHGPGVLTWRAAGRRVQEMSGRVFFSGEAA